MTKIDDWYPDLRRLRNNELATLRFLKDNPGIAEWHSKLYADAHNSYSSLFYKPSLPFQFESQLDIEINNRCGIAHIGSEMMFDNGNFVGMTYYLAICEIREPRHRLIRKYHFDYARPSRSWRQPHPVFHLQYAGGLSPRLSALDFDSNHMDEWLSEPRLVFCPMSLALLLNIVLKEFPGAQNDSLVKRSEWRDLIAANEKLFIDPFLESCRAFVNSKSPTDLFTNDFCYGT